ncbi:MAG: hypothetical protein Q7K57_54925 [Burkholderiaceae bacterium]|nr:hypothetical protein [Burkholderiaceae bacterium]
MSNTSEHGPQAFFRDLRAAFGHTLQDTANAPGVESSPQQAWDSFDGNVAIQCEGQPPIACHKGCPSCCTLRVGVLAPEVFMIAAYLRATAATLQRHGINLAQRIREADAATRGLSEVARVALNRRCAYIEQGVCLIHRVRPPLLPWMRSSATPWRPGSTRSQARDLSATRDFWHDVVLACILLIQRYVAHYVRNVATCRTLYTLSMARH